MKQGTKCVATCRQALNATISTTMARRSSAVASRLLSVTDRQALPGLHVVTTSTALRQTLRFLERSFYIFPWCFTCAEAAVDCHPGLSDKTHMDSKHIRGSEPAFRVCTRYYMCILQRAIIHTVYEGTSPTESASEA